MSDILKGKYIVLGVCAGIAAYKVAYLLRLMTKAGADVRVLMTENAENFVGRMTFEALSNKPVCRNLFEGGETSFKHIDWAEEADAVVVAPATANMVGKFARGIADDALSTLLMVATCPVIVCPSMNTNMYLSPAVQRNVDLLKADGHTVLEPGAGQLACGTEGPGRLPEPEDILDRLCATLTSKDLEGKRFLVTAGPTQEPFDPVRYITNPSTGKMGYAVARQAEYRGARVTLVSGPTHLDPPHNVELIKVRTAGEMAEAVFSRMAEADVVVKTAAVGDYRPKAAAEHKLKKSEDDLVIELARTTDILQGLGERKTNQILVGFAAETQNLNEYAQAKIQKKNLDMIVGNLVNQPGSGFGTETNTVTIYDRNGDTEPLTAMTKDAVANRLLDRIVKKLKKGD